MSSVIKRLLSLNHKEYLKKFSLQMNHNKKNRVNCLLINQKNISNSELVDKVENF